MRGSSGGGRPRRTAHRCARASESEGRDVPVDAGPRYERADLVGNRLYASDVRNMLERAIAALQTLTEDEFVPGNLEDSIDSVARRLDMRRDRLLEPIATALTGTPAPSAAIPSLVRLGRSLSIERLERALATLTDVS